MSQDLALPPGCTIKHGRYYLIRRNRWEKLTRVSEGEVAFWRAYYRLTQAEPNSMAGVLLAYLEHGTDEITPGTRKKYEQAIVMRLIPYCGHMPPDRLSSGDVAQYLQARKEAGAAVAGNRERAALSSAINFAMRRGWMDSNPCHGVRRNRERPSKRYVEHGELVTALDRAPLPLYHLMSAAYLTGARQTDLMAWTKANLTKDGIEYTESKTGKPRLIRWTPTLTTIISAACARSQGEHVFVSETGKPWTVWGLQSALRRFQAGFRFRDLRPKAETDSPGILGHSGQMRGRYTRRTQIKPVK